MKYLTFYTKGFTEIVLAELNKIVPDAHILETQPKLIIFETDINPSVFKQLRTFDDILILFSVTPATAVPDWNHVNIAELITPEALSSAVDFIKSYRSVEPQFSITLSVFQQGALPKDEIMIQAIHYFQNTLKWVYKERERQNFDIRFHLTPTHIYTGVRLTDHSLYQREYKKASIMGALRPSLAGALVQACGIFPQPAIAEDNLNDEKKPLKVVDNFRGCGTILAEAFACGADIYGGDINSEALEAAFTNLGNAGWVNPKDNFANVRELDARHSPWTAGFFDVAISNLPWDSQIKVNHLIKLYIQTVQEYKRILKPHGTIALLGTRPELLRKYIAQHFPDVVIKSYQLGYLGQRPSLVVGKF